MKTAAEEQVTRTAFQNSFVEKLFGTIKWPKRMGPSNKASIALDGP